MKPRKDRARRARPAAPPVGQPTADPVATAGAARGIVAERAFFVILLLALATRAYVLWLTRGQPVWWDEAEYLLKARSIAQGTPDTGYFTGRPIVMPLMLSGAFALGWGEGVLRLGLALASVATVLLTYDIGRRLFSAREAAVAGLLMTVFYVPVFYTARIMTEIPHLLFCLLGVDLYLSKTRRAWLWAGPALALGVLLRFPAALMLGVLGGHAALTRRVKQKALWISAAGAVVVVAPYLIWAARRYGDPLHAWRISAFLMPRLELGARAAGLGEYLRWLASSFGWPLVILLVMGAARSRVRRPDDGEPTERTPASASTSLLWLWAAAPVLYFGLCVRPVLDRYLILALPPLFLMIARGATWLPAVAPKRLRKGGLWVAAAAVVLGAVALARDADRVLREKLDSHVELREAGQWLQAHTAADAVLVGTSPPHLTYYAQRPAHQVPNTAEAFARLRREWRPPYLILSRYQDVPQWLGSADLNALGARIVGKFSEVRPLVTVLELSVAAATAATTK